MRGGIIVKHVPRAMIEVGAGARRGGHRGATAGATTTSGPTQASHDEKALACIYHLLFGMGRGERGARRGGLLFVFMAGGNGGCHGQTGLVDE